MSSEDSKLFRMPVAELMWGQCPSELSTTFPLFDQHHFSLAWNHPSHCWLQSDLQWCSEVLVNAHWLCTCCLKHSHTDTKVRCNQEYFPDSLQAEAMVPAVTSLLKKNSWTTPFLGPAAALLPHGALRHPRRWRKPLRNGILVLKEATANNDLFFFMPIEKSVCSWWSIKCFQLVLLLLLWEVNFQTQQKKQ